MKNTSKVLGIAVIIAAIALNALSMTGCAPAEADPVIESISVTTQPTKTTYNYGDTFDPTGMVVTATYDNGSTSVVTDYTTDYDTTPFTTVGTAITVTVTYGAFTDTLTVTVIDPYIITPQAALYFKATKTGNIITTGTNTIQNVIDAIKANANGAACIIQFGDGTDTLDLGTDYVTFTNTSAGSNWGAITLIGKITTDLSSSGYGTIYISSGPISVTSNADIANTNTSSFGGKAIYNYGTLNIIGGTITNPNAWTVYNYAMYSTGGVVNISGGTIQSTGGWAVSHYSANGSVNITGGTISSTTSRAVYNQSTGTINISGGAISTTSGSAVYNASTGAINITGGTITGGTGYALYNYSTGTITYTGATITGSKYPSTL